MKYGLNCYKVQFIFFHLTPNMGCNAYAWPSKNNVKLQCQNQVAQNYGLYVQCTTRCRNGQGKGWLNNISISLCFAVMHVCTNLPPPPPPFTRMHEGAACVCSFSRESGVIFGSMQSREDFQRKPEKGVFCQWYPIPEIEGFIRFPRQGGLGWWGMSIGTP